MSTAIRRSDRRRCYIRGHPFLALTALGAALAGPLFAAVPAWVDESALGVVLGPSLERAWCVIFGVAGWLVISGLWRLDAKLEVYGLLLLAGCYAGEAYAAVNVRGVDGLLVLALLAGPTVGCVVRAFTLRYEPHDETPWHQRRHS